jgi:hypothetical protein
LVADDFRAQNGLYSRDAELRVGLAQAGMSKRGYTLRYFVNVAVAAADMCPPKCSRWKRWQRTFEEKGFLEYLYWKERKPGNVVAVDSDGSDSLDVVPVQISVLPRHYRVPWTLCSASSR